MPLVEAKCTNCGANLQVESTKEAAICPCCGTPYIVEKAINNYNITNTIEAPGTESLLKRGMMFLEDGDYQHALEYFDKVLDIDPENVEAYLGRLMMICRVSDRTQLKYCSFPFDGFKDCIRAVRFGDEALKAELEGDNEYIRQTIYNRAVDAMDQAKTEGDFKSAAGIFAQIPGWRNADELREECLKNPIYNKAVSMVKEATMEEDFKSAADVFAQIPGWKNADELRVKCLESAKDSVYSKAVSMAKEAKTEEDFKSAADIFAQIPGWRNADELRVKCLESAKYQHKQHLQRLSLARAKVEKFKNLISVRDYIHYIRSDGKVFGFGRGDISEWADIVSISVDSSYNGSDSNVIGLKSDGTVAISGYYPEIHPEHAELLKEWNNIVAISINMDRAVGVKSDGTVVSIKTDPTLIFTGNRIPAIPAWTDITAVHVCRNNYHGSTTCYLGLKSDGTVVYAGENSANKKMVETWTDIVAVHGSDNWLWGLKSDGTVVSTWGGAIDWSDIVAISVCGECAAGLKSDGTVVIKGRLYYGNDYHQFDLSGWKDIVAISVGRNQIVGLKSDGTLITTNASVDVSRIRLFHDADSYEQETAAARKARIGVERKISALRKERNELRTKLQKMKKPLMSPREHRRYYHIEYQIKEIDEEIDKLNR